MSSFKHVLLNNRLHLLLMIFRDIFSNSRTGFLRSAGRSYRREPRETDMANHEYNTNDKSNFILFQRFNWH